MKSDHESTREGAQSRKTAETKKVETRPKIPLEKYINTTE